MCSLSESSLPFRRSVDLSQPQPIIVTKTRRRHHQQPHGRLIIDRSNYLIILVSRPRRDTLEGWKEIIAKACYLVDSGSFEKGGHTIYIVCAVGIKYMAFYWNPKNAGNVIEQLRLGFGDPEIYFPSQLMPSQNVLRMSLICKPLKIQNGTASTWTKYGASTRPE